MARFDVTDWCDLVRGVADPDGEWEMRELLASGDADARKIVDVLSRVAAVARMDREASPPEFAVRMAKAIGSIRRPPDEEARSSILRFLPFEVTFDSLREPALAGTRDMQVSFRQLSFESEGYTVDLRWDRDTDPRRAAVVGQLLRRSHGEGGAPRPMAGIPVLAAAGGAVVGHSLTSELGEFHAADLPEGDLELYLLVGAESCIKLPLTEDAGD